MAVSHRNRAALLLFCALPAAAGAQILSNANAQLPITVEAQSNDLDFRNNMVVFHKVKITQGKVSVEAEQAQANGVDSDNSRWQFHGKVKITVELGFLTSDDAEITFADKLLTKAVITGKPAEFEQRRQKTGQLARGRADSIIYDVKSGTVNLTKNAWLSDGQNEIRGDLLKYSISEQRVVANAAEQGSQRVRIIITPPPAKPKP